MATHGAPTHHISAELDADFVSLGAVAALVVRRAALKRAGRVRRSTGEDAIDRRGLATGETVGGNAK